MEQWKDIPGYEGLYKVSDLGNVLSVRNNINLKPGLSHGYKTFTLCNNKKRSTKTAHLLVSMAFLNHKPCKYEVVIDHINDIKTDNRVENLQIVTQRFNVYKTQGKYSSQYKGVHWSKQKSKWNSRIHINGKRINLGLFNDEDLAGKAYQDALKKYNLI